MSALIATFFFSSLVFLLFLSRVYHLTFLYSLLLKFFIFYFLFFLFYGLSFYTFRYNKSAFDSDFRKYF